MSADSPESSGTKSRRDELARLVELLAERGDHDAALAVESFWEDLSAKCSFNLLCGYSSAHFAPAAAESALRRICRLHRAVHANSDDALGEWLLAGVE